MNDDLEKRIKALEDNQIKVIMSNNADQNVLRSVQRVLANTNLAIGSVSTSPCALLALNSITKGLLFSNMTTAQRDLVVNPKSGLTIFNTDTDALETYHSTKWGFVPSKMTTTQRDAISSPVTGTMIYNTSTSKINFYDGGTWRVVTST